jgi:hypothetical protein
VSTKVGVLHGYILGEKLRSGSPEAAAALSAKATTRDVRDNLRVKEVKVRTSGSWSATTTTPPNVTPRSGSG